MLCLPRKVLSHAEAGIREKTLQETQDVVTQLSSVTDCTIDMRGATAIVSVCYSHSLRSECSLSDVSRTEVEEPRHGRLQ